MAKGIIAFDLDGTLVTCASRQITVLQVVAKARGVSIDGEAIWQKKRAGQSTLAALVDSGMPEQEASKVAGHWQERVEEPVWLALDTCFPDSISALKRLGSAGFEIALITARSNRHWVPSQLIRLGLAPFIDSVDIVSPREAREQKARILLRNRPVLYVGDSEVDAGAAQQSGVSFCAVDRGQRSREFLRAHGVRSIVHGLEESLLDL